MKTTLITIALAIIFLSAKAQQTDTLKKSVSDTTITDSPVTPPEFPGGQQKLNTALFKLVRYPDKAQEDNIQRTVVLVMVIEKVGSITIIKVKQSSAPVLDKVVIRIVKLLHKFNPGKDKNGTPVRCYYNLPYSFTLVNDN